MDYKRILTIQDISCLGQCSGTVALPIISACGHECVLIPSAVLSTHTAGFKGYTFSDFTEEIPNIYEHWKAEGVKFDCVYTGYLGNVKQIKYVVDFFDNMMKLGGVKIVDPAMADNGALYPGFDDEYVTAMGHLCAEADIIIPNITEACLITGMEYKENYDQNYILELLSKLDQAGCGCVVLTGVSYREGSTGVVIYENGFFSYYEHEKIAEGCHGTGDVYSAAFAGALMKGQGAVQAACIAADYTLECIRTTREDEKADKRAAEEIGGRKGHWYGVEFERELPMLIERLK